MNNELFPEIAMVQPPLKLRAPRKKSNRFTKSENNRRYRLHRKVKNLSCVKLDVRNKYIEVPHNFNLDFFPSVKELVFRFKYYAQICITPPPKINNFK